MSSPMRIVWHWFTMGPYHFARMRAIANQPGVDLTVIETTCLDDHGWERNPTSQNFRLITLSNSELNSSVHKETAAAFRETLEKTAPDVVVASGYAEAYSRSELTDYQRSRPDLTTLFWSESTEADHKRQKAREAVKRVMVKSFDGCVVAGKQHADYVERLGMARDRIQVVGNVVDNDYFSQGAAAARERGRRPELPERYFLYVGRFIPFKNLSLLLRAYARYRDLNPSNAHGLVLVGGGPEEASLRNEVRQLGAKGVHFAGSKQPDELLDYYAFADYLVLSSFSEPWGLVVNEAMATGVPALISKTCGCAEDLIVPGRTGWTFDPNVEEDVARTLSQASALTVDEWRHMSQAARAAAATLNCDDYASRAVQHIRRLAAEHNLRRSGVKWYLPVMNRLTRALL